MVTAQRTGAMPSVVFDQLLHDVRQCRLCAAHWPLEPRPVLQIDPRARILVASQAPGRKAHASGVPFSDPSGVRLRDWMGVTAAQFYDPALFAILPMGFCYPGTGASGDLAPRPECAPRWREALLAQLPALRLTLVIGQYAMAYHLPAVGRNTTVTAAVLRWRDSWPAIVPLPHPSPRNNLWLRSNPWFEQDLLPALRAQVAAVLREAK